MELAQGAYETVVKQGLVVSKAVQRNKAATALRVVVRNEASGNLGRVIIPFSKVPM